MVNKQEEREIGMARCQCCSVLQPVPHGVSAGTNSNLGSAREGQVGIPASFTMSSKAHVRLNILSLLLGRKKAL